MDPTLQNALAQPSVLMFGAVRIELPNYTLRLLDGAGAILIDGELYTGIDPTFGTLSTISELSEEMGNEAPEVTIGLMPPDMSAMAVLADSSMQGSLVRIMVGAADPLTGMAIGQPETLFLGEIDVPTPGLDANGARTLEYTVVSVFERLFEVEEGQRASNAWHQTIWPGERGLEFMTGTDKNLYWGVKPPKSSATAKSGISVITGARQVNA